jgi:hypothetical protein
MSVDAGAYHSRFHATPYDFIRLGGKKDGSLIVKHGT